MEFENDANYLDQHFLVDKDIINKFINEANIQGTDTIVEVGPGKGVITELIAKRAGKVYCIELDTRLKQYLDEVCKKNKNVEIIYANVLDVTVPECDKIITALPYSIIEPFMYKMLRCNFKELIMITGNRFADNVDTNEVNKLSLLTNCFFKFEKIMEILPESFNPRPRVVSAMLRIEPKDEEEITDSKLLFFRYMYCLNHKKIKNALIESYIKFYKNKNMEMTQRMAKNLIEEMQLNDEMLDTKFETCSNDQLKELYKKLIIK